MSLVDCLCVSVATASYPVQRDCALSLVSYVHQSLRSVPRRSAVEVQLVFSRQRTYVFCVIVVISFQSFDQLFKAERWVVLCVIDRAGRWGGAVCD